MVALPGRAAVTGASSPKHASFAKVGTERAEAINLRWFYQIQGSCLGGPAICAMDLRRRQCAAMIAAGAHVTVQGGRAPRGCR